MKIVVVPDSVADDIVREHHEATVWDPAGSREHIVEALLPQRVLTAAGAEQARRNAALRETFLDEFTLLDSEAVALAAGSRAGNRRSLASRWRSEKAVFGVELGGRIGYPEFQFDDAGRPRQCVAAVLQALAPLGLSGWATAAWWITPHDMLGWARPVDRLESDPAAIAEAAAVDGADLGT